MDGGNLASPDIASIKPLSSSPPPLPKGLVLFKVASGIGVQRQHLTRGIYLFYDTSLESRAYRVLEHPQGMWNNDVLRLFMVLRATFSLLSCSGPAKSWSSTFGILSRLLVFPLKTLIIVSNVVSYIIPSRNLDP